MSESEKSPELSSPEHVEMNAKIESKDVEDELKTSKQGS